MNLLSKLFKKRNYKLLLYGGGILYKYKKRQYYIGSENYTTFCKTEVSINRKNIREVFNGNYLDSDFHTHLNSEEKKIILNSLITELNTFGCHVIEYDDSSSF